MLDQSNQNVMAYYMYVSKKCHSLHIQNSTKLLDTRGGKTKQLYEFIYLK